MFSAGTLEVFHSTTFRRTFAALLTLWVVLGGALVGISLRTEPKPTLQATATQEILEDWLEFSEEEVVLKLLGEGFVDEALEFEIDPDLPEDDYYEAYVEALRQELHDAPDPDRDLALRARLAFLGFGDDAEEILKNPTALAYAGLMYEELPERYHERFEELGREALERWGELEESYFKARAENLRTRLEESLTQQGAGTENGNRWRHAIMIFALIFVFGASLFLARPMQAHLAQLRHADDRLTEGDFGARLRAPTHGDFRAAAREINTMLDRLEQSVAGLSQVTSDIAHDLRTPLTRLQGQLDMLKQNASPAMVEAVQGEVDQLIATFNALLRIAQVESGSRRSGFRDFDMAQVIADVVELYEPAFSERSQTLTWRMPASQILRGDRDLWMQALSNLFDNALKYTPEGGRIDLRFISDNVLQLRDSGPGIPESERDNVFQRFYRLQRHRGARGNGLGLSLVRAICELHRAEITLGHEGGLVVRINFP